MNLDELMKLLHDSFNKEFKYELYQSEDFKIKIKLFTNNNLIGIISHPLSLYNDICYMFGSRKDDFYKTYLSQNKIPNNFKTFDEFANYEIKNLYVEQVKEMLNYGKI